MDRFICKLSKLLIFLVFIAYSAITYGFYDYDSKNKNQVEQPQKVFLHTDKNIYSVGESIWCKAYVLKANNLKPDTRSTNLFIEITDHNGELVFERIFKLSNGSAYGEIIIPDSLHDGNYMIYAFTEWMRAFPEETMFFKNIYIKNPEEKNYILRKQRNSNKRFNELLEQKEKRLVVNLGAEGGDIVAGIDNRIGVRVKNEMNENLAFSGAVFDKEENKVADISLACDGVGYFNIVPGVDREYIVRIQTENGLTKDVALQKHLDNGILFSIDEADNNEIVVKINSSLGYNLNGHQLIVKKGFEELFKQELFNENIEVPVVIDKASLSNGVNYFCIKNSDGDIVAERLYFIYKPGVFVDIEVSEMIDYKPGYLNIPLNIKSDYPVSGSVSYSLYNISVCDEYENVLDPYLSLKEEMLLYSDIKGYDRLPEDIDIKDNQNIINYFLITQKWSWSEDDQIKQKAKDKDKYFPKSLSIYGKVKGEKMHNVIAERLTVMLTDEFMNRRSVKVDKDSFVFDDVDYDGLFKIWLSIEDERGIGKPYKMDISMNQFDEIDYNINSFTKKQGITEKGENWKHPNPWYKRFFKHDPDKGDISRKYYKPDQIIDMDDVANRNQRSMRNILIANVAGIHISPSGIVQMRGGGSFMLSNEPLFLVDGVTVSGDVFLSLNLSDIQRIDVYKSSSATAFGAKGKNGALYAHTRKSEMLSPVKIEYLVRGYTIPEEFEIDAAYENGKALSCATLYFEPEFELDNANDALLNVPGIFKPGKYMIVIQGIDDAGNPFMTKRIFELK